MTTAIVMIMVLRKLVSNQEQRWLYAAIVVVAANAGGAFSQSERHNHITLDQWQCYYDRYHLSKFHPCFNLGNCTNDNHIQTAQM
ncbi:hypothetical protein MASR1M31_12020 [Porphyromonadaceae bacterium]